ncbi:hypothetical protein [Saccharopolyspora shandongensis]|uniref:hypothetical protein n=1 Tax=Saccharopolyspora shandongensis TaxID=418495 RepID=UPI0033F713C6
MPATSTNGVCPGGRERWAVLSRHRTSQGEVTYRMCFCGRIGVFLDDREVRPPTRSPAR